MRREELRLDCYSLVEISGNRKQKYMIDWLQRKQIEVTLETSENRILTELTFEVRVGLCAKECATAEVDELGLPGPQVDNYVLVFDVAMENAFVLAGNHCFDNLKWTTLRIVALRYWLTAGLISDYQSFRRRGEWESEQTNWPVWSILWPHPLWAILYRWCNRTYQLKERVFP